MEFPTLVYRCPGTHQRPGGTFDYLGVNDQDALLEAIDDGWYPTLGEAVDGKLITDLKEVPQVEIVSSKPVISLPPRKELELQAKQLGIVFNVQMRDDILFSKIKKALRK